MKIEQASEQAAKSIVRGLRLIREPAENPLKAPIKIAASAP